VGRLKRLRVEMSPFAQPVLRRLCRSRVHLISDA
jgi:hypothetical protein